jgi:catechol 2,3-dioxygenase-like lactoylglutathione lyase family enzyme
MPTYCGTTEEVVMQVAVVALPVSDQERAKAFYVGTLGWELVRDDDSVPGLRWVQVSPSAGSPTVTLVTWFDTMPAGSVRGLVFSVPNVHDAYTQLVARGVEFDGPPQEQPWGTETVFRDPDGNEFVLQQAA